MACCLFGTQPLPERMLSYCQFEQNSVNFKSKYKIFHSWKYISKCDCKIAAILSQLDCVNSWDVQFICEDTKIGLYFLLFLNREWSQLVENFHHGRQGANYPPQSIPLLLMAWKQHGISSHHIHLDVPIHSCFSTRSNQNYSLLLTLISRKF